MSTNCKCRCKCRRTTTPTPKVFCGDVIIKGNLTVEGNLIVRGTITDENGQAPRLGTSPGGLITTITHLGMYNRSQLSSDVVINVASPFDELALIINYDTNTALRLTNRSTVAVPIVFPNLSILLLPNYTITYTPGPDPIVSGPNPA